MSYTILRRNPAKGTIVVRFDDARKAHIRTPDFPEGSPEFDAEIMRYAQAAPMPDWYNEPGDANPFTRTMPVYDRRRE